MYMCMSTGPIEISKEGDVIRYSVLCHEYSINFHAGIQVKITRLPDDKGHIHDDTALQSSSYKPHLAGIPSAYYLRSYFLQRYTEYSH